MTPFPPLPHPTDVELADTREAERLRRPLSTAMRGALTAIACGEEVDADAIDGWVRAARHEIREDTLIALEGRGLVETHVDRRQNSWARLTDRGRARINPPKDA